MKRILHTPSEHFPNHHDGKPGNLGVPYWLPKLEGKSNWALRRKFIEEAMYEVHQTDVYWDIIMDTLSDDVKDETEGFAHNEPTNPNSLFFSCQSSEESDSDSEVIITGCSCNGDSSGPGGSQSGNRRVLNIRAREILGSSHEFGPQMAIDRVSDTREAY